MTVDDQTPHDLDALTAEPDQLDGHTIDELADYLDAGMLPADPSIDDSPACQNALAAIARVRVFADDQIEADAADEPDRGDSWVGAIMQSISLEATAGRDIPLETPVPTERIVLTEGSVRSVIRRAADTVDGVLVGRCSLDGDVTVPGEPIRVRITATLLYGYRVADVVGRVRAAVHRELLKHTQLDVVGIDVSIRDLRLEQHHDEGIEPA